MSNIIEIIKSTALDAVIASKPTEIRFGTITSIDPIAVKLSDKLTVSGSFLYVLEDYAEKCKVGDVVVILRVQGGQKFVVLDRAVST